MSGKRGGKQGQRTVQRKDPLSRTSGGHDNITTSPPPSCAHVAHIEFAMSAGKRKAIVAMYRRQMLLERPSICEEYSTNVGWDDARLRILCPISDPLKVT